MFGNIGLKTRPVKLAFLVDPNSQKQVRQAIQLSSSLWGGSYFPIIPLHKKMPKTWREGPIRSPKAQVVISGYIEAFDPDILVQLSKDVPQYVKDSRLRIIKPDEIWETLEENWRLVPKFGIGVFEILNDLFKEHFKYKPKYPVKIVFPKLPRMHTLFWASVFGELPSKIMPQLKRGYFEPLEIETPSFNIAHLKETMAGNVLFPRRITTHEIETSGRAGFGRDACVFFMDANKVEDIIDYWNLRAMGRGVIPLPKQYKDDPQLREIMIEFLKSHRRPWRHNPQACDYANIVRARSCSMEEIQKYAETIKIDKPKDDVSNNPFFSLQHWYPRVWDEWARDKDGAVPVSIYSDEDGIEISETDNLDVRFHSVFPKFADKHGYTGEPRCANEVGFRFYGEKEYLAEVFPKLSGDNFIRAISSTTSFRDEWRVGRDGLVNLVKSNHSQHWKIPKSEDLVFAWLKDLGWIPKESAPGLLARQIYKRLDGFPFTLANEGLLGLLEHMNGGTVKRNGTPADENKINDEREMSVGEVKSRLAATSKHHDLHGYLLSKEIFKIGLRLKCQNCLRDSWFSLEEIKTALTCPKCLTAFPAIGNVDSGQWCYKTSGPFSVSQYAEGAYAVLLGLHFFSDNKMHSIQISPALSFTAEAPDKKNLEADFAAFWRENRYGEIRDGLLFAECKTYGKFGKKDFERMAYLAKTFPGAVLVFCTLRKSLTVQEIAGITRIAKKGRKHWKAERPINPVLILTGTELLSQTGPPYCWEDAGVKQKFNHIHGLLEVCDATQQLYLKLPSWQDEWHKKWDKRSERMKARLRVKENPAPNKPESDTV